MGIYKARSKKYIANFSEILFSKKEYAKIVGWHNAIHFQIKEFPA
jgi:hypothetical protein